MFKKLTEIDEAEFKADARRIYRDIGYPDCLQVLYELVKCGELMAVVFVEERQKEKGNEEVQG